MRAYVYTTHQQTEQPITHYSAWPIFSEDQDGGVSLRIYRDEPHAVDPTHVYLPGSWTRVSITP